jgi:hypothetical protein
VRKIWKLSDRNFFDIKSSAYSRENKCDNGQIKSIGNEQRLSSKQRTVSKNSKDVEMSSKKNRLTKTYVLVIPRRDPDNIGNALRLNWKNIEKNSRRRKDIYTDNSFLQGPSIDRLIKKPNYFKNVLTKGKAMLKRELQESKCIHVKEFILYYENKGIKVFDSSARGKDEYCGPCQLSRITLFALNAMKNPYFLLLQEMFSVRGISIIDAYLKDTADSTWKSYKSRWNTFVRFLVEKI